MLASPTLGALCHSFYEEEKWQHTLMVSLNGDDEWIDSVTLTMVSLAATSVRTTTQSHFNPSNMTPSFIMRSKSGKLGGRFQGHSRLKNTSRSTVISMNTSSPSSTMTKDQVRSPTASNCGQRRGASV